MVIFGDLRGVCPNCGEASGFKQLEYRVMVWPYLVSRGTYSGSDAPHKHASDYASLTVIECLFCNKTVLLLDRRSKPDPQKSKDVLVSRVVMAPEQKPRSLSADAPAAVTSLYEEASQCENAGALRAAGVMYRAAVEELVKHQGATGRTLFDRIDSLNTKLPVELIADLHEARLLGNDSIHAGLTYSADEVADVAALIDEAILVLYVQPAQKRHMREQRNRRRGSAP